MNRILSLVLLLGIAATAFLAWQLNARLPPASAELDADLAAVRSQRTRLANEGQQEANRSLDRIYEQTEAMLQQKRLALLRFVNVTYQVEGRPVGPASEEELAIIDKDLGEEAVKAADAKAELAKYAGGLIRTLIAARLATVELTIAGLEQRRLLLKHRLVLPAMQPQPTPNHAEALAALEQDIKLKEQAIAAGKAEASQYSGGLIQGVLLSRIETDKLTLSLLEQRRAALKHGINYPMMGDAAKAEAPPKPPGKVVGDKEALQ